MENTTKTYGIDDLEVDNNTPHEGYASSTRAQSLAMELSKERKRLKKELAELQTEVEDLTPTTPTGTPDWYVKWFSMVAAVISIQANSARVLRFVTIELTSCVFQLNPNHQTFFRVLSRAVCSSRGSFV